MGGKRTFNSALHEGHSQIANPSELLSLLGRPVDRHRLGRPVGEMVETRSRLVLPGYGAGMGVVPPLRWMVRGRACSEHVLPADRSGPRIFEGIGTAISTSRCTPKRPTRASRGRTSFSWSRVFCIDAEVGADDRRCSTQFDLGSDPRPV